jgi:hypothetical protein
MSRRAQPAVARQGDRTLKTRLLWVAALACGASCASWAQEAKAPTPPPAATSAPLRAPAAARPSATAAGIVVPDLTEVAPADEAFTLQYGNRPIIVFRARVLGRTPEERATATVRRLDDLVDQNLAGPVDSEIVGGVGVVLVAGREALTILPTDLDPLAGETLEAVGREAAGKLARALTEVVEARSPGLMLRSGLRALAATVVALLLASLFWWVRQRAVRRTPALLEAWLVRPLERHARGDIWRTAEAKLLAVVHFLGQLLLIALAARG